ncbi:zf-HC2 domain-containing protein [Aquibacillus sediminis]|uniref:zf-HC2 domain-containing protein n=1 Tax=Aquibacillus sediminis TaxID=2574734 RepID=UPI001486D43F|nr:zf-HC2 domain-containing protein [Aquibacillus sediminis]
MSKKCDIVKDLIPIYVENLTSEDSNQFVKEHLNSCEDCKNYIKNVKRDLPNMDSLDIGAEKNDQKLIKGIKSKINNMMLIAVLIGVLVGIYGSMMFLNINEFQSILMIYPIATFFIGLLSFILFKKLWIGPSVTLLGGIISVLIFMNLTFWIWIIVYTIISLLGALVGKGVLYFSKRKNNQF